MDGESSVSTSCGSIEISLLNLLRSVVIAQSSKELSITCNQVFGVPALSIKKLHLVKLFFVISCNG